MYCAVPQTVKICDNTTTVLTGSSACNSYVLVTQIVVQTNTTCTTGQMQLTTANEFSLGTASPFHLTNSEGGLIAAAILLAWAFGWSFKIFRHAINGGSPE